MKTDKIFKENINYFKKNGNLKLTGIILAAVSAALYFFGWSYVSYIIASIGLPVGLVLFVVGSIGRSDESDLDGYVARGIEGADAPDPEDDRFERRRLSHLQPQMAKGYEYADGLLFKKDKNGHIRSSLYTAATLYPMKESLCVYGRTLSLIADEKTDIRREIAYKDVEKVSVSEDERWIKNGKSSVRVKDVRLVLMLSDGEILSLPVENGIDVERFAEKVNELANNARTSAE